RMLGVWAGRIMEENAADQYNQELVNTLKDIWAQAQKDNRTDEFINIAQSDDPVIRDAWDTLGWRIKAEAEEAFGADTFMVRKDMVNDAIGYRSASVTDIWTGVSRWKPEHQEKIQEALDTIIGTKAYQWLRQGENLVHDAVSFAKTTIIVRSIVVGVD